MIALAAEEGNAPESTRAGGVEDRTNDREKAEGGWKGSISISLGGSSIRKDG